MEVSDKGDFLNLVWKNGNNVIAAISLQNERKKHFAYHQALLLSPNLFIHYIF